MDEDGQLDFSGYTPKELREARSNINPQKYPKNLANLIAEAERRGLNLTEPEAAQPANQSKTKKIENGFWPSVSTWKGGEKAAKQGVFVVEGWAAACGFGRVQVGAAVPTGGFGPVVARQGWPS